MSCMLAAWICTLGRLVTKALSRRQNIQKVNIVHRASSPSRVYALHTCRMCADMHTCRMCADIYRY